MKDTVFILAGGNDRKVEDYGKLLDQEIAKYVTNPKILSCFFSAPPEAWKEKAHDWEDWFSKHFAQPFTFDYAKYETFLNQIDAADVIYFHGGDTELIFNNLPDTQTLKEHLRGKLVVGSSAGANMLSKHYWSSTYGSFGNGRGLVDKNVMVHYGAPNVNDNERTAEDWQREETEFQKLINGQPVTRLPEGQFVIVKGNLN